MVDFTRRGFLQSAAFLAGAGYSQFLLGDAAAPKFAKESSFEPTGLFLTWQRDPTTTMTIQWVGAEGEGDRRPVWFAKDGTTAWQTAAGTSRRYPMTDQWIFRTELTGLEPETEYLFRVGLDSVELRFRTMPAKATNTIQFVSGGDSGISNAAVETNRLAAKQSPSFVVMGGDIAYENGRSPETFLKFLKNYSRDLRDARGCMVPLLGCLGNHECDGGYRVGRDKAPFFYAFFDGLYPEKGFASLDFGDYMSLVFLDTEHTTPVEGEQTDWLERTLKERVDRPNLFVYNHVPAYPSHRPFQTTGEVGTGEGNRKHWVPLFERYNVDGIFEHHDHTYKRSHPLLGGMKDPKGLLYLGDGSWGKIRKPDTPENRPYLAKVAEAYHMSVHRIEGPERFHVALADNGKLVDIVRTVKRAQS